MRSIIQCVVGTPSKCPRCGEKCLPGDEGTCICDYCGKKHDEPIVWKVRRATRLDPEEVDSCEGSKHRECECGGMVACWKVELQDGKVEVLCQECFDLYEGNQKEWEEWNNVWHSIKATPETEPDSILDDLL